ncbi:MAG: DUF4382 domain-containing protein [Bacteroidia bacterium]|nr:DUF4382 domain-containing protein [Bacteroidia bacterium]MBT8268493.1 DUF4382 domain-containing protein [Bacteroidia bacterium]
MFPRILNGLLAICLLSFLWSCSIDETFDPDDHATLSLKVSGSLGAYDNIFLEFSEVHLKVIDDESDPKCWRKISSFKSGIYDLNELVSGREADLLNSASVPSGQVFSIKLVLGENNYVIHDGERIELFTNSVQLEDLNMRLDKNFNRGRDYIMQVDFNANESIFEGPLDGQLILQPEVSFSIE